MASQRMPVTFPVFPRSSSRLGKFVLESRVSAMIQSGSTGPHSRCVNCSHPMNPMQFPLSCIGSIAGFVLSGTEKVSDISALSHHVILSPRIDSVFLACLQHVVHRPSPCALVDSLSFGCLHSIRLVN